MVPLLGLTRNSLSLTEEQFSTLMALQTFDISVPEVTTPVPVPTDELLTTASTTTASTAASPADDQTSSESTVASSEDQTATNISDASSEGQNNSIPPEVEVEDDTRTSASTLPPTASSSVSTEFPDNFREPRDESTTESNDTTDSTVSTEANDATTSTEAAVVIEESSTEATTPAPEANADVSTTEESVITPEESTVDVPETTSSEDPSVETSSEATSEASTTEVKVEISETTEVSTESTTTSAEERLAEILSSNELLAFSTFLDYEPDTDNFDKIPALDTLILTCDMLTASGDAASSISSTHLSSMTSADLTNCLETLGRIRWTEAAGVSIWKGLKTKLSMFQDPSLKPIKRDLMIQLNHLLPAIATHDADLIDVTEDNIDGISLIGK